MGIRRKICDIGDVIFRIHNQIYPLKGMIINFHRVLPDQEANESCIAISVEQFTKVIELIDSLEKVKPLQKIEEGGFFVTFDDGFFDIFDYAYPILKEKSIPFTIFLVANMVEEGKNEYLYGEKLKVLLEDPLCNIGSHTNKHLRLRDLTKNESWEELYGSKKKLENMLDRPILFSAFPEGSFHAFRFRDVRLVKKAGYSRNFLTMTTWLTTWGIKHCYMTPRYSIYKENYDKSLEMIVKIYEKLEKCQGD